MIQQLPPRCSPEPGEPIEVRHVEAAVLIVARAIVAHGEVYAPILDRLERELTEMRGRRDPMERARAILSAHTTAAEAMQG